MSHRRSNLFFDLYVCLSLPSTTESNLNPEGGSHDVSNDKLQVIDLERKSKFGNLLDSLRVRSEGLPYYSRKHAYKIRRKNLIDAQPVKER